VAAETPAQLAVLLLFLGVWHSFSRGMMAVEEEEEMAEDSRLLSTCQVEVEVEMDGSGG